MQSCQLSPKHLISKSHSLTEYYLSISHIILLAPREASTHSLGSNEKYWLTDAWVKVPCLGHACSNTHLSSQSAAHPILHLFLIPFIGKVPTTMQTTEIWEFHFSHIVSCVGRAQLSMWLKWCTGIHRTRLWMLGCDLVVFHCHFKQIYLADLNGR